MGAERGMLGVILHNMSSEMNSVANLKESDKKYNNNGDFANS